MFDMTTAAMASLIGVIVVVGISMYNEDLNVGIVAIAFAVGIGSIFADLSAVKIMQAWPLDLFMILTGVCFLFGIATTNGTMEKFTSNAIRLAGGNTALIPLILFILITAITTIGPGNIATVTLMAPVAMAIANRIGMSAFLMTLLVVGAANGAAFSPIAEPAARSCQNASVRARSCSRVVRNAISATGSASAWRRSARISRHSCTRTRRTTGPSLTPAPSGRARGQGDAARPGQSFRRIARGPPARAPARRSPDAGSAGPWLKLTRK